LSFDYLNTGESLTSIAFFASETPNYDKVNLPVDPCPSGEIRHLQFPSPLNRLLSVSHLQEGFYEEPGIDFSGVTKLSFSTLFYPAKAGPEQLHAWQLLACATAQAALLLSRIYSPSKKYLPDPRNPP
jgi:hypothetical protein